MLPSIFLEGEWGPIANKYSLDEFYCYIRFSQGSSGEDARAWSCIYCIAHKWHISRFMAGLQHWSEMHIYSLDWFVQNTKNWHLRGGYFTHFCAINIYLYSFFVRLVIIKREKYSHKLWKMPGYHCKQMMYSEFIVLGVFSCILEMRFTATARWTQIVSKRNILFTAVDNI